MVPSQLPTNSGATAGLDFGNSTLASPVRVSFSGRDCGPALNAPSRVFPSAESVPVNPADSGPPGKWNEPFPSANVIPSSGSPDEPLAGIVMDPIQTFAVLSRSTSITIEPSCVSTAPLQWPLMSLWAESAATNALSPRTTESNSRLFSITRTLCRTPDTEMVFPWIFARNGAL